MKHLKRPKDIVEAYHPTDNANVYQEACEILAVEFDAVFSYIAEIDELAKEGKTDEIRQITSYFFNTTGNKYFID